MRGNAAGLLHNQLMQIAQAGLQLIGGAAFQAHGIAQAAKETARFVLKSPAHQRTVRDLMQANAALIVRETGAVHQPILIAERVIPSAYFNNDIV